MIDSKMTSVMPIRAPNKAPSAAAFSVPCKLSCGMLFAAAAFISLCIIALFFITVSGAASDLAKAPEFTATDANGRNFSLSDFRGSPLVLHITNIEVPLCVECEKSLKGQVNELIRLKAMQPDVQIVTLNLRKNPYSKDGKVLAEKWWRVNITWPWTEDIEPYAIGSKYLDYWNVQGGSSNPTILLIDKDGGVAGVYHVYRVGEGVLDGVQSAEILSAKLQELKSSQWKGFEGEVSKQNVSAFGMFLLGILTSLAPCSIALLIAVFSYVLTVRRKDEYLQKSTSTSREGFMMGIAFTLGMAAVFFVLGLFISQIGFFIRDSKVFDLFAGVIMILLGIGNFKPLEEIIEPVTSRIRRSSGYDSPDGDVHERGPGLMQRAVETSVGLFKHSAFIGGLHSRRLLCPGLGTLRAVNGPAGPDLAGIAKRDASGGRHDALHLRRGAWNSHNSHCHLLPGGGRQNRRQIRIHRQMDHQVLRAAGNRCRFGVLGQIFRRPALVDR